jgi:hypothetical protein
MGNRDATQSTQRAKSREDSSGDKAGQAEGVWGCLQSTTSLIHTHKYIRRDGSYQALFFAIRRKSLRRKEFNIEVLSHFSRAPTFENSENAVPKSLRRKEFGKICDDCRAELAPLRPVCLR